MNKKIPYVATGALIVLAFLFGAGFSAFDFGFSKNNATSEDSSGLVSTAFAEAGSEEKYKYLSIQRSSSCGLQPSSVDTYSDDQRIQGACCSAIDIHRYQEQVEGLKKYSNIDVIPEDSYDIPASLAKRLFDYQRSIALTPDQQAVYDRAVEQSDEGGPCCCKCWRWTAFEGQAKYLISELNFTADEIAEIWDLEDGCGGNGHTHDS